MAALSIDELFARALEGDNEDEGAWEAIRALRKLGTREVFDRAANWCASNDPKVRNRGVNILAQIGSTAASPGNKFPTESFSIVSKLVSEESDIDALNSEIIALGHIGESSAVPFLVPFTSHPDPDIRSALATSLCTFANDERCVRPLLTLMNDADDETRDWATFALASQGDLDSDEIRMAFLRGLDDSSEDVSEEALVGLAKRKDERVLPTLIAALETGLGKMRVIEAASWMLGMDTEPGEWNSENYLAALRQRFPQ